MVSGLNQNVEIGGRVFHVQTEVVTTDEMKIETTVFLDGRVIGSRELPLDGSHSNEEELRARRDEQHATIVRSLLTRMADLQAKRGAEAAAEPAARAAVAAPGAEPKLPSADGDDALLAAIRVRTLLAKFRDAIDVVPPASPQALAERLQTAAAVIGGIVDSPIFAEIRLDEQMRFNMLKQRVDEWLGSSRDHASGVRIWSEVVVFSSYLGKINDRADLQMYDKQLLAWSVHTVGRDGMTDSILAYLQSLFGLDVELDRLLDAPDGTNREHWLQVLLKLRDSIRL